MSELNRLPELRQRVKAKEPVKLEGDLCDISYAMAEMGAKDVEPITFSPLEQVRYEENERFGRALVAEFIWLVGQKDTIDANEFRKRASSVRQKLTPPQQAVFDGVIVRVEKSLNFCATFNPARLPEVVDALKTGNNLAKTAETVTEIRPLGIVVSVVENDGYRVSEHGGSIPLDDHGLTAIADPTIREAIKHCVIMHDRNIELFGNARGKEHVIKHEMFHNLYKLTIAPEQKTTYRDPVKHNLFTEGKDEIIAYLLQGIWEFHPESLFLALRRRERALGHEIDPMSELWGMVAQSREANKQLQDEERGREADVFIDELWAAMRTIGFLRFAQAPCEEGIHAVLAAQDFKEMAFALLSMQEEIGSVPAMGLWNSFRSKDKPPAFYHELKDFLEEYQWLRLPQLDHPAALLESLHAYVKTISANPSIPKETVERLEGVYNRLAQYFG